MMKEKKNGDGRAEDDWGWEMHHRYVILFNLLIPSYYYEWGPRGAASTGPVGCKYIYIHTFQRQAE